MVDYYEVLGVPRTASANEVRQAYLKLARERHPDRFVVPEEKATAQEFFKELTAAFNTLFNDKSRQEYDEALARPPASAPEEMARQSLQQGIERFEARDYQSAVELFRIAAHLAPGEARCHALLGRALAKNPHWVRQAIQALERAVELAPQNAAFHTELARLLQSQGLTLRARRVAEKALGLAPADPDVRRLAVDMGLSGPSDTPSDSGSGLLGILRRKP